MRRSSAHLALVFVTALNPGLRGQEGFLEKRVCRFIFRGSKSESTRRHLSMHAPGNITEAIGDLTMHAEVPICFEELPSSSDEPALPIEIDARETTVRRILEDMVAQDPRYLYRERLGVIEVLPKAADQNPSDCLNMAIPLFRPRNQWNALIQSLRCEVDIVAHDPKAVVPDPWVAGPGCGGSFLGLAHPPPGLIEANFEDETVRDILDHLCAKVGNMAWSASFRGARPGCDGLSFTVRQPRTFYPSDTPPVRWTQGLPGGCTSCHYHKPCRAK